MRTHLISGKKSWGFISNMKGGGEGSALCLPSPDIPLPSHIGLKAAVIRKKG